MTRIRHRLLTVLIAAMLCPLWVYGGSKKPKEVLTGTAPPVSAHQGMGQAVVHQEAQMTALDAGACTPWTGDDRQQAHTFFSGLKQRQIAIQPTFYKMLGLATQAQRGKLVSRCQLFFDSVDTQEVSHTSCLTSMIRTKKQVCSFLSLRDDSIRRVATTPALRSLTSLFNKRGFPRADEDTQAFMAREVWWQGEGKVRTLDRDLLRVFSSMLHSKGLPNKKAVDDYLQLDLWWQGEGEARTLDRNLLRTFSSMFKGRGLPGKKAVEEYLQWEIWWQGEGKARTLDRTLLRAFSLMFNYRGLPEKRRTDEIVQWLTLDEQLDRQAVKGSSNKEHTTFLSGAFG